MNADIFSGKVCSKSRDQKPHHKTYSNKCDFSCFKPSFDGNSDSVHIYPLIHSFICIAKHFSSTVHKIGKYCAMLIWNFEMMTNIAGKVHLNQIHIKLFNVFFFLLEWSAGEKPTHTYQIYVLCRTKTSKHILVKNFYRCISILLSFNLIKC